MSDGEGMAAARRRRREEDGRKPPRFSAGATTSTVEHARRTRAEELLALHEQRSGAAAFQPSISHRSRRLAERARAAGGSVFDRLHHESEEMLARKATRQANELASENAEFHQAPTPRTPNPNPNPNAHSNSNSNPNPNPDPNQATTPHALSSTSRALLSLKDSTDGRDADTRVFGDRLYEQKP
eukprot:scaffold85672_cov45-Phaeocystis_antarctica.AAC.2